MWSWGLSNDHARFNGLTAPTSPVVQQAMVNLFAEMGVQPDTLQTSLSYATQSSDTSPPVSTITSIAGGQPLTSDRIARITGTASDVGGGNVAAVEVSTDGGSTWSYATGTTNWSYSWIVPQQGNYTVMTRAIDDTAHLETPSDATTVSVVSSGLSSLFTQSPGDTIAYSSVSHNDDSGDPNSAELGVKFQVLKDGTISALRFYKAATDTGQHTVSLWSGNGTLLATATSTNETASGWQTVALGTPVTVTAGTSYVASYHTSGNYVLDTNYFVDAQSSASLSTSANAGVYRSGTASAFPNQGTSAGENYWVDVEFSPGVAQELPPVASNDSGFATSQNTALQIAASSLLANDTDPNNDPLTVTGVSSPTNGTVSFNAGTNTITFTPASGFEGSGGFTYSISDGRGGTSSAQVAVAVNPPGTVENLFPASTVPTTSADPDPGSVELGVRFSAAVDGQITGISYYKSATDTGTHTGALWTSNGTVLASGTFTNETSSGWQTLTFSTPVSITAGTTYVAGFHSNGHYAATPGYFTSAYTNGDLTAPVNAGVYTYGASGSFPTSTYNATSYDVSVAFVAGSPPANQPPVASNDSGFTTAENTAVQIAASSLLANDTDPNGDTLTVTGVSSPTNGTASFNAGTNTITFTPTTGYAGPAGFTYAISDGKGGTASAQVSLTVTSPVNQPPVASNDSGFTTAENTAVHDRRVLASRQRHRPERRHADGHRRRSPTNGTVELQRRHEHDHLHPDDGLCRSGRLHLRDLRRQGRHRLGAGLADGDVAADDGEPLPGKHRADDLGGPGSWLGRARRQVLGRRRRPDHRHQLLQERDRTPAPTRARCGPRTARFWRAAPSPTRRRAAGRR